MTDPGTTNTITAEGIALVERFEGFRAEPYFDAVGVRTIGYGHAMLPNEDYASLTEEQAADLLINDLARFGTYILNHITAPLNDNQFSALASLTFNVGTGPLFGTMGRLLNEQQYAQASAEFDKWVYAAHRKLNDLVERRTAEKALFNEPPGGGDA